MEWTSNKLDYHTHIRINQLSYETMTFQTTIVNKQY